MSSRCLSRRFFTVDEALSRVLDGIDSDSSEEEAGAARSSTDARRPAVHERRSFVPLRSSDESDDALEVSDGDWEDADSIGARAARDFVVSGRDGESSDSDGGTRSASSEDESDEELTEEAMVMRKGCGCSVNHFAALDAGEVRSHRLSCLELEKAELDGVIIGRLAASVVPGQVTARGKQRSRDRFSYTFGGRKVCVRTFRYVHAIGKDRLTNLQTHYKEKGVEPRVRAWEQGKKAKACNPV